MISIVDSAQISLQQLRDEKQAQQPDVTDKVRGILADVKQRGDAAVLAYTQQFDGVCPEVFKVSEAEMQQARSSVGEAYIEMLQKAAANIRAFHEKQLRNGFVMADTPGVVMGQKITPLARVGVYVPGGTAVYPSTVLMDVLPAKIAGVPQIIMVTPPGKTGEIHPGILAAASVAGVTSIYKMGGAQAIAALAYGTQSVPQVDKIVGPGNVYVATAKQLVYGQVDIDMIAGPSDVLIVADETATPCYVAADMLAQAEHDENAAAVLVTTSKLLAQQVQQEIETQLPTLTREKIARASIEKNGRILLAKSLQAALDIANALAPEHLEICVNDPFAWLPQVQNAGSIFLGHTTPEALGDYYAGPNHTLPTGGTARFYSPLSVDDFSKKSSYLYYSKDALQTVADDVVMFANSEGLQAHANSVLLRVKEQEKPNK